MTHRTRAARVTSVVAGALAALFVPLIAAAQAPQVDELFLPEFQAQFDKDAGKVRIVLLLAPS